MTFDWDPLKAESNLKKHKVSFEKAITAFDDPFALRAIDQIHSTTKEMREWLLGKADAGVLVIVFTVRQPGDIYRIISARPAKKRERRRYEEFKRISV